MIVSEEAKMEVTKLDREGRNEGKEVEAFGKIEKEQEHEQGRKVEATVKGEKQKEVYTS